MSWQSVFDMGERYPLLSADNQSSIEGLYLAGDVAATPDIRSAVNAGRDVASGIAELPRMSRRSTDYDVIIIGGGPAGVAAALELKRRGKSYLLLERRRLFQALRILGSKHPLYTSSKGDPENRSALPFDHDCAVGELLRRWDEILSHDPIEVIMGVQVAGVRHRGAFEVETAGRTYLADRLIVTVGKVPFLRKLDASAEAESRIHYTEDGPPPSGEQVVVVADCAHPSATRIAVRLSGDNSVFFVCEDSPSLHARQSIDHDFLRSVEEGRIRVLHGTVREVTRDEVLIGTGTDVQGDAALGRDFEVAPAEEDADGSISGTREQPARVLRAPKDERVSYDRIYALGGILKTEVQVPFFRKMGLRFEGEWGFLRWALLSLSFVSVSGLYLTKKLAPQVLMLGGRDLGGWYPFLYSAVVIVFGLRAIRRYRDPMQTQKISLLIFFQVFFFAILPELILHNWKSYGLAYVWPLVLSPVTLDSYLQPDGRFYFWWTLMVSAIGLPLFVIFGGKRYCTYVCGCGGLAETLGDSWRHLSPKGKENTEKERTLLWVTWFTVAATVLPLVDWIGGRTMGRPLLGGITPRVTLLWDYGVNLVLIAIIPMAVYPFLGGKIWCRYWCPVVGFMDWIGKTKSVGGRALSSLRSRFRIDTRRERCIACGMCDRFCEVGVPVMKHALKGVPVTLDTSSCIACGICVSVCPTDALKFPGLPLHKNRFVSRPGW